MVLPAGEFEGPVTIDKSLSIIGSGTTIWVKKGAAIVINSDGVTLENLRVELTEGSSDDIAVLSNSPSVVKDVEVLGKVSGFGAADGFFDVPRTIELGTFAADETNTFTLSVNVPERTEILCGMREVQFSPTVLEPGRNTLAITVSNISAQTLLYTEVLFKSTFTRRIYLSGKPITGSPVVSGNCVYTAPVRDPNAPSPQPQQSTATDVISLSRPQSSPTRTTNERLTLQRGQRVALTQYLDSQFSIFFTGGVPTGWEVDPYVFLLGENGKTMDESGLVFFGNCKSPNEDVTYTLSVGRVDIDLAKTDYRVAKIVLAYSIYAGNANKTFAGIVNPCIKLHDTEDRISFPINGLTNEITVVALEFYRYKGEWKISAVGAGYNDGMAKLCNGYGLEVI